AEDGIRECTVTGVQTCALPISSSIEYNCRPQTGEYSHMYHPKFCVECGEPLARRGWRTWTTGRLCRDCARRSGKAKSGKSLAVKIGRASCRGKRVEQSRRRDNV